MRFAMKIANTKNSASSIAKAPCKGICKHGNTIRRSQIHAIWRTARPTFDGVWTEGARPVASELHNNESIIDTKSSKPSTTICLQTNGITKNSQKWVKINKTFTRNPTKPNEHLRPDHGDI